jgi:hypothetical protein
MKILWYSRLIWETKTGAMLWVSGLLPGWRFASWQLSATICSQVKRMRVIEDCRAGDGYCPG